MKKFPLFLLMLLCLLGFLPETTTLGSSSCQPRKRDRSQMSEWQLKEEELIDLLSTWGKKCQVRLVGTAQPRVIPPGKIRDKLNVSLFGASNDERVEIVLWREKNGKPFPLWRKSFINGSPFLGCMPGNLTLMDLNQDRQLDLILEGNDSYCTGIGIFLNQGGLSSFSPKNFTTAYETVNDERLLLDLDRDGDLELLVRPGLYGRVGAAEIPMGCDEILPKLDEAIKDEFTKSIGEPYLDKNGKAPEWIPVPFLPTEKVKILGFDSKNRMNMVDQTRHYQKHLQWRLGILKKILASPESFVTDQKLTDECRKKIEGTIRYLKKYIE